MRFPSLTFCVLLLSCVGCSNRAIGEGDDPSTTGSPVPPPVHGSHWSESTLTWSNAFGVIGAGGGIKIFGEGTVQAWKQRPMPLSGPPDYDGTISADEEIDLFTRLGAVDLSALPHGPGIEECSVTLAFTACDADCTQSHLEYVDAAQVTPQMNAVWAWFDARADLVAFSPAKLCND
jgi:hypothetical protein